MLHIQLVKYSLKKGLTTDRTSEKGNSPKAKVIVYESLHQLSRARYRGYTRIVTKRKLALQRRREWYPRASNQAVLEKYFLQVSCL